MRQILFENMRVNFRVKTHDGQNMEVECGVMKQTSRRAHWLLCYYGLIILNIFHAAFLFSGFDGFQLPLHYIYIFEIDGSIDE